MLYVREETRLPNHRYLLEVKREHHMPGDSIFYEFLCELLATVFRTVF